MTAAKLLLLAGAAAALVAFGCALAGSHTWGHRFFRAATLLAAAAFLVAGYRMVTA